MCKTFDAVYELSEHVESDILICFLNHLKIEGKLHKCDKKEGKCYDDVITLKDAVVTCPKSGYSQEYTWLNVPSKHIQSFAFKCCEKQEEA